MGLPDVSKPKAISVEVPSGSEQDAKPKRGRPAGSKTTTKKPAATSKKAASIDASQVSLFLQTMSAVIATRPNMGVFMLTPTEAEQIATPLASIISKNSAIAEAAGEYADHITLLIAAITIFIPKFLLYKQQAELNKPTQLPREDVPTNATATSTRTGTTTEQSRNSRNVQNDSSTFNGSINQLISPIA